MKHKFEYSIPIQDCFIDGHIISKKRMLKAYKNYSGKLITYNGKIIGNVKGISKDKTKITLEMTHDIDTLTNTGKFNNYSVGGL